MNKTNMEITKHEFRNGVEYWEVKNPRGYSARWGDVFLKDGELTCKCVQFEKYGKDGNGCEHSKHINYQLMHVEKREDYKSFQAEKWGYK